MEKTLLQRRIRMEQKNSETTDQEDIYDIDLKITEAEDLPEEKSAMSGCPRGYCPQKNS